MVMAPCGVWWGWWQWVGSGDGGRDEGLAIVQSWRLGGLVHVAGALKNVVGPWAISSLLVPPGDGSVVFEGVVETHSYLRLHQPVVDSLFGVVPLGPVSAQLLVSFFKVLLVEGGFPQAVDVCLYSDIVEVLEFGVN